jgi:hypothetical protein
VVGTGVVKVIAATTTIVTCSQRGSPCRFPIDQACPFHGVEEPVGFKATDRLIRRRPTETSRGGGRQVRSNNGWISAAKARSQ